MSSKYRLGQRVPQHGILIFWYFFFFFFFVVIAGAGRSKLMRQLPPARREFAAERNSPNRIATRFAVKPQVTLPRKGPQKNGVRIMQSFAGKSLRMPTSDCSY